jgi:glycerol-3-phosphate dehydrogenase (NAD(P)+)
MTESSRKVLVLGYGEMGHAMEVLLGKRHQLMIWEKYPRDDFVSVALEEAVPRSEILLFCLPVIAHRSVLDEVIRILDSRSICLSIAKGLDEEGKTAAQIFDEKLLPSQPRVLLYGPMISEEIRAGRLAFGQLGFDRPEDFRFVHELFAGTPLHIEPSDDIPGISWSVILKNVYAMLFGISDELQLGDNMRGFLATAVLRELDAIIRHMGGKPGTVNSLAGLGDLITTATSESSHHHELGRMLARGETENISGEGVHTLEMVIKQGLFATDGYPLFSLMHEIIEDPVDVRGRLMDFTEDYFSRALPAEDE